MIRADNITHPYGACLAELAQHMPESPVLSVSVGTQNLESVGEMKGEVQRISASQSANSSKFESMSQRKLPLTSAETR